MGIEGILRRGGQALYRLSVYGKQIYQVHRDVFCCLTAQGYLSRNGEFL